jgi:hypothetical protein
MIEILMGLALWLAVGVIEAMLLWPESSDDH